jgi:serine protease Do
VASMLKFHISQFATAFLQLAIVAAAYSAEQPTISLDQREEVAIKAAVEKVAPSVVQIRTVGGLDSVERTALADGPTTGLVISPDGYILSSAFNFAQQPASIVVMFADGKQSPAELIATDHSRMIVLLKATNASDLPVPTMAPVAEVHPGQWAIAIGRAYRTDRANVTVGVISALNRMYGRAIQTDADVSLANYGGPLIDIRGRVLGLVVPMAPRGQNELAGAEWYDSGIGFAVPLGPLADRIAQMKKGHDLRTGLLGIGLLPKNPHSSAAELASVRPDSPAGQAGLKKGDRITEINGKPIKTQTDLRFALGAAYAGDPVRVVAMRDKDRVEKTITLAGEFAAFHHAFLGILPIRSQSEKPAIASPAKTGGLENAKQSVREPAKASQKAAAPMSDKERGILVRMVYPGSPAAESSIQTGDRVIQINDSKTNSIADAIGTVNGIASGNKVSVRILRDGNTKELSLQAASLPTILPNELPPAYAAPELTQPQAAGESRPLKLPEFRNKCQIYVPAAREAARSLAAVIWLQSPSDAKPDSTIKQWQSICDRDGILLVVPSPAESDHWERNELDYLRRLAEHIASKYQIDPNRFVAAGQGNGGSLAWVLALANRDLFHGAALIAAPLPRAVRVPQNEPTQRLSILAALPASKEAAIPVSLGLKKVAEAGYNITTVTTTNAAGQLSDDERNQLARWLDSLDRF